MSSTKLLHAARLSAVAGALAVLGLGVLSGSAQAGGSPVDQTKPQAAGIIAVLIGIVDRDLDAAGRQAATGAGAPSVVKRSQLTAPLGSTKGSFVDGSSVGHILPYVEQDQKSVSSLPEQKGSGSPS